jgi:hypothetical protein
MGLVDRSSLQELSPYLEATQACTSEELKLTDYRLVRVEHSVVTTDDLEVRELLVVVHAYGLTQPRSPEYSSHAHLCKCFQCYSSALLLAILLLVLASSQRESGDNRIQKTTEHFMHCVKNREVCACETYRITRKLQAS